MLDRVAYIKSDVWDDNEYLVEPVSKVKKCKSCEGLMYAAEFPNFPEAIDGVLPVCMRCFKKYARDNLQLVPVFRKCSRCGEDKMVGEFRYEKNHNRINKKCADCVGAFPKF